MRHIRLYNESAGVKWRPATESEFMNMPRRACETLTPGEVARVRSVFGQLADAVADVTDDFHMVEMSLDRKKHYVLDNYGMSVLMTDWLGKEGVLRTTSMRSGDSRGPHPLKRPNYLVFRVFSDLPLPKAEVSPHLSVAVCKDADDYYYVLDQMWRQAHTFDPKKPLPIRQGSSDYFRCDGLAGLAALVAEKTAWIKMTLGR